MGGFLAMEPIPYARGFSFAPYRDGDLLGTAPRLLVCKATRLRTPLGGNYCFLFWSVRSIGAYQSLKAKNLTHLELRRYNGCEHLMIVREALPDAFAFFDRFANRM